MSSSDGMLLDRFVLYGCVYIVKPCVLFRLIPTNRTLYNVRYRLHSYNNDPPVYHLKCSPYCNVVFIDDNGHVLIDLKRAPRKTPIDYYM